MQTPLVDEIRTPPKPKSVVIPAVVGLVIGSIFILIFLAAFHAPRPHAMPIGVVGSAAQLQQQLPPGLIELVPYDSPTAARDAVTHREVYGAYLAGERELLYAGANGPGVTGTLEGLFPAAATRTDVLPTSAGDTRGLSIFYAGFGLVLGGFLFGLVSYQMAPRLPVRLRALSLAGFAVTAGVAAALIAGRTGFNALPGNPAVIASVTVLLAMAVGSATLFLMRIAGPAGTMLASLVLLILGNATGGGTLPSPYLPGWLAPLSHVLPAGLGIRALQGVSYFHHDGYVLGVVLLAVWSAAGLGLVRLIDLRADAQRALI
ncbi:hypothetical protein [Catenuloplanes japonicus]|uniref:hypothetical protein n=1 Tax=Catenuloplanes japonicus TaxID=33876 RepID=UPI0007C50DDE|nr:hypothetical protein [Catenuloplanes japonicus]